MRSLFFALLLCCGLAWAEPVVVAKPVVCDSVQQILSVLQQNNHKPIWTGQTNTGVIAVFANPETTEWAVVQFISTGACVIETGTGWSVKQPESGPVL
jgi:hypothetical protein